MKASTSRRDMENMVERDEIQDATNEAQLKLLHDAVQALYYAAVWHADRPVDEQGLWTAVRDAAGFKPGKSPKPIQFEGVRASYDLQRIRLLCSAVRREDFSTEKARALLLLHGQELQEKIDASVRQFIEEKLS
jgi:hypothetical protein